MESKNPFYNIVVCGPLKTVYCPIPKAANTSWKEFFRGALGLPPAPERGLIHNRTSNGLVYTSAIASHELVNMLFAKTSGWFKFVIVRNPYERAFSAWCDKLSGRGLPPPLRDDLDLLKYRYCQRHDMKPGDLDAFSFEQFLECLVHERGQDMNHHWAPQVHLACLNVITYDMVVQLEKMQESLPQLCARMGVDKATVPHLNAVDGKPPIGLHLTGHAVDHIRKIYAADFRRFGYDPADVPE